ncbi:MAG TPA: formate dehydrogenase accessory sulfurtransferase FdhD [Vicinamibacterales bacterium]|nr:formate dehydrogenase accessory sulfurtransferase FdhD [Vicinamibacterales bacterium]
MANAIEPVQIVRVRGGVRVEVDDRAAAEEPLAVRIGGRPFATIMRTPGADRELAAGFLLAERIISTADDLGVIEQCRDEEARGNTINVTLVDAARAERALSARRDVTSSSSCGVCGRQSIDSLLSDITPIASRLAMTAVTVAALPDRLRASQRAFDETGGLHAAGLFTASGELVDIAEDIGRHNAVDKVIGRRLLLDQLPLTECVLCVSGRTSFEIVQKAAVAGIPILAAVSAPSTLAIALAATAGITLVGFVRGDSMNIYSHAQRIT